MKGKHVCSLCGADEFYLQETSRRYPRIKEGCVGCVSCGKMSKKVTEKQFNDRILKQRKEVKNESE